MVCLVKIYIYKENMLSVEAVHALDLKKIQGLQAISFLRCLWRAEFTS